MEANFPLKTDTKGTKIEEDKINSVSVAN